MASSINASTSGAGGVITTADNTGILQLQAGGTTIATISSTGLQQNVGAPAFSAYQGTLQSISNNTNTKLTINTEDFDTNSNYDNATNYRFTPTVAGYYQINGAVYFASPSQDANVKIFKNGVNWKIGVQGGTGAYIYGSTVSDIIYFNGSTDYVELYGYQNSGTSKNTEASRTTTYFSAAMIRSA